LNVEKYGPEEETEGRKPVHTNAGVARSRPAKGESGKQKVL